MNPDMFFDSYTPFGGGALWGAVARMMNQNKAEGVYIAQKATTSDQSYQKAQNELNTALADMLEASANDEDISTSIILVDSLNQDAVELEHERDNALWDLRGAEEKQTEFYSYLKDMMLEYNDWLNSARGLTHFENEQLVDPGVQDSGDSSEIGETLAEAVTETRENLDQLSDQIGKLEANL